MPTYPRSFSNLAALASQLSVPWGCAVVDGLKYQKSHEWIKVEGDIATIGISDFAQVRCQYCHASASQSQGGDTLGECCSCRVPLHLTTSATMPPPTALHRCH